MVAAPQKRRFVVLAKKKGLSERAACRLVRLSRTVARYRACPKRPDNDALVHACLHAWSAYWWSAYKRLQRRSAGAGIAWPTGNYGVRGG